MTTWNDVSRKTALSPGMVLIVLASAAGWHASVSADDVAGVEKFLPETTVAFVEVRNPPAFLGALLDHPISRKVQSLEAWETLTKTEGYRGFLTGRKFFEVQIGDAWRPAAEALTAGGIFAAWDLQTKAGVVLVRGKDAGTMENFRTKVLELTKLSQAPDKRPDDYRGHPVYRLEKSGAAVVGEWFVLTTNADLGKSVLDRIIDEAAADRTTDSFSRNERYLAARARKPADDQVWGFVDVQAVRESGGVPRLFEGQTENPLAELLVGGIQSTLRQTPWAGASLSVNPTVIRLRASMPFQSDWIPESRHWYFGETAAGRAPELPQVPEALLTIAFFRDVSQMWLRAGDLFDQRMNDQLAEAESNLTTIFAGRDFAEEILGSFAPELGIIVARQSFDGVRPVPAIRLPAFALVAGLKDPETMRPELRRTFQSAIGFFNIVGAQNGQPQLEMDMQKAGDQDLILSHYVPEKKDRDSETAPLYFNFSPSVGFAGRRFVLASTADLARKLTADPQDLKSTDTNFRAELSARSIADVLADNRNQLVTQNMLEEGRSREEAEAAIDLVFELIRCFRDATASVQNTGNALNAVISASTVE